MTRAWRRACVAALLCVASGCATGPYPAPEAEPAAALRPRGREPIDSGDDELLAAMERACRARSSPGAVELGLRVTERLRDALGSRCELDTASGEPLRIHGRCAADAPLEAGVTALAKATTSHGQTPSRIEVVIAGDAGTTERLPRLAEALRAGLPTGQGARNGPVPAIDLAALSAPRDADAPIGAAAIGIAVQLVPNPEAVAGEGACPPPTANRVDLLQCLESCSRQEALVRGSRPAPRAGSPSLFGSPARDDAALFAAGVQLLELASAADRHLDLIEACRLLGDSAPPCAARAVQNLGASGTRDIQDP